MAHNKVGVRLLLNAFRSSKGATCKRRRQRQQKPLVNCKVVKRFTYPTVVEMSPAAILEIVLPTRPPVSPIRTRPAARSRHMRQWFLLQLGPPSTVLHRAFNQLAVSLLGSMVVSNSDKLRPVFEYTLFESQSLAIQEHTTCPIYIYIHMHTLSTAATKVYDTANF